MQVSHLAHKFHTHILYKNFTSVITFFIRHLRVTRVMGVLKQWDMRDKWDTKQKNVGKSTLPRHEFVSRLLKKCGTVKIKMGRKGDEKIKWQPKELKQE